MIDHTQNIDRKYQMIYQKDEKYFMVDQTQNIDGKYQMIYQKDENYFMVDHTQTIKISVLIKLTSLKY